MRLFHSIGLSGVVSGALALALLSNPPAVRAQETWQANGGAESKDMGKQALAFLPNEIWIHVGDSITWTWQSDEFHTLTFLTSGQVYPSFQTGCPGFSTSPASFDGTACVTSPPMVKGQTFTVQFPKAGNYKFECLVHNTMTGSVHVLDTAEALPHNQAFYDKEAAAQRDALLSDTDGGMHMDTGGGQAGNDPLSVQVISRHHHVTAGFGEISSTPGGIQTMSVVRFLNGIITIHAGDTVEWTNHDPEEPHTVTFGPEPADEFDPSPNVTVDSDGALHAIITSTSDKVHSGFLEQALEDEPGLPSNPLAANPTRFRVTFTQPGTYPYKCVLHHNLGMVGKVIVLP